MAQRQIRNTDFGEKHTNGQTLKKKQMRCVKQQLFTQQRLINRETFYKIQFDSNVLRESFVFMTRTKMYVI